MFEQFADQKFQLNFEALLEQSSAEFQNLLKVSTGRFPVRIRSLHLPSRKFFPDQPPAFKIEEAASEQADPVNSKTSLPSRPSIDIEDKMSSVKLSSQTAPSLSDSSGPLTFGPLARSDPMIQTENFPRKCNRKFTLVLDLDETLIYFKNDIAKPKFLIRPYAYCFLKNLSAFYEIIIFTAAQKEYADWILDKIDSKKNIVYRLYREHCQISKTSHIKDLRLLGRDLSKTIIVDNFSENFALHKDNGICIKSWYGDLNDQVLISLEKFLLQLVNDNVEDVRPYMKLHIENDPEKGVLIFH